MIETYQGFTIYQDVNGGAYIATGLCIILLGIFLANHHGMTERMGPRKFRILIAVMTAAALGCFALSVWIYRHGQPTVLAVATPQYFYCADAKQSIRWSDIDHLTLDTTRSGRRNTLNGYVISAVLKDGAAPAGSTRMQCRLSSMGVSVDDVARVHAYWLHYRQAKQS